MKKIAFTLAEIMIVLSVIAVLTAILLPAARNAMPNQDVIKFKKGHNALYSAINELVNSDKYYNNGDLGAKANGALIDGTHEGDSTYFCSSLADVLNVQQINCLIKGATPIVSTDDGIFSEDWDLYMNNSTTNPSWADVAQLSGTIKEFIDLQCSKYSFTPEIAAKNANYFQISPEISFGEKRYYYTWNKENPGEYDYTRDGKKYFYYVYKTFCLDIDDIGKGVEPFGYGIRVDGKILNGARAEEWLEKSIQNKD